MKKEYETKDYRFLIIIVSLLVLTLAFGIFLEKLGKDLIDDSSALPDTADEIQGAGVIFSEVLTNNGGVYISEDGLCCDFVEIYNSDSRTVSLFGYGLSDRTDRVKWAFPDMEIGPGEYIVVNLTGKSMDGLNASFKLSSTGGEELILVNNKGKIVDAVKLQAIGKNQSIIRNERTWEITSYPTPGFENSEAGLSSYRNSLFGSENSEITINEFLCKNEGNYINEHDRSDGYVEFINSSDHIVALSDYYLSDNLSAPFKFRLPKTYLAPGEVFLLYCGDNSFAPEEYTGFGLQNKSGSLFISKEGKIIDRVDYENVPNGCAYIMGDNGEYYVSNALSPGYPNSSQGVEDFQKEYIKTSKGLIISEVMSSNNSVLPQNGYMFYDWIELFNNSGSPVKLSEYSLTTDIASPGLFALPDVTLDPGAYYIIMCSGDTALSNDSYVHSNFKIGTAESIYLTKGSSVVDSVFIYDIPLEYSYSRDKEFGWTYTSRPTPGSANGSGYRTISPVPQIELPSGIYNDVSSISVAISGQGKIYYTTDGSDPTTSSRLYTGPISVWSTTVIKAATLIEGSMISANACSSFIVNDPHKMPVASLSLDPWEYYVLYENYYTDGLIYQGNFELFENDGSVSCPCGITISGKSGKIYTKKNYGLKFEGEYGAKSLDYKVFDDLDCSSFDSIILRGGSNAEMSLPWKDEFASRLAQDSLLTRMSKTCALYINGDYKGIFNIREKITPGMLAAHHNVDKSGFNIENWSGGVEAGEDVWTQAKNWGLTHDLSSDENYYTFCKMVDVEDLCDLWIFQMYMNNPDIYNIRVYSHPDIDDGRCKFIFFDLDLAFYGPNGNYLSSIPFNYSGYAEDLSGHSYDMRINLKLLQNSKFRQLFLERLSYHLHNSLSTDNTLALFDYYTALYAPEIERDLYTNGYSTEWYYSNIDEFRWIIANRTWTLMSYAQSYFGLSSSEMSEVFGDLW